MFYGCDNIKNSANTFVKKALTDTTYTVSIPQNIGGALICKIKYSDDFNSWTYDINYSYKGKSDSVIKIGSGRYEGKEWNKDDQLFASKNWMILKTKDSHSSDKLLIGKIENVDWKAYVISPKSIEEDSIWKVKNIDSDYENYDSVSEIKEINDSGEILVIYKYAKRNRIFSFMTGKRLIIFQINPINGNLEMKRVQD